MNAEFFGAVGARSMNVSSDGLSSTGVAGEKTPPKAARKNATSRWMRIAASSANKTVRVSYS
jgi:hypothetical protein